MKVLLNYGGGVNSTALLLQMHAQECWNRHEIHVVFSDTGCEWPETMEYIEDYAKPFCDAVGWPFVVVESKLGSLYDYCVKVKILPSRRYKWCSDKFKHRPLARYAKEFQPDIKVIGIDGGEDHRAKSNDPKVRFPLVEAGIDRDGCIRLIKKAGFPVPMKSGCYFCPMQRKDAWYWLREKHPGLFEKAVKVERIGIGESGREFYLATNTMTVDKWVKNHRPKLTADQVSLGLDPDDELPCFCTT